MPEYNSNPNQRSITVYKAPTDDKEEKNYYTKINLIALQNAMSTLSFKAFELWVYISKNMDKHFFWLSKVDCLKWCNMKDTSYYNAFEELKEKGYLVQKKDTNKYNFYEIPKEKQKELDIMIEK